MTSLVPLLLLKLLPLVLFIVCLLWVNVSVLCTHVYCVCTGLFGVVTSMRSACVPESVFVCCLLVHCSLLWTHPSHRVTC